MNRLKYRNYSKKYTRKNQRGSSGRGKPRTLPPIQDKAEIDFLDALAKQFEKEYTRRTGKKISKTRKTKSVPYSLPELKSASKRNV